MHRYPKQLGGGFGDDGDGLALGTVAVREEEKEQETRG
jgi:hypothetical protein